MLIRLTVLHHPPRRGRHDLSTCSFHIHRVSIHAPAKGATFLSMSYATR